MPDVLTPAERAAIAAYKGEVQRIPRGVSGEDSYIYCERARGRGVSGGLVTTSPKSHREWLKSKSRVAVQARAKAMKFAALKRREETPPKPEVKPQASLVMVSPPTITVEKPKPKKARHPAKPRNTGAMKARIAAGLEKRERTRVLILSGMSHRDAAREIGCHPSMVEKNVRALRESGELPPAWEIARRPRGIEHILARDVIAERREQVQGMWPGMKQKAIAEALGVSLRTIESDVRAIRRRQG